MGYGSYVLCLSLGWLGAATVVVWLCLNISKQIGFFLSKANVCRTPNKHIYQFISDRPCISDWNRYLEKKTIYVLNIGRTQQSARQSNVELHANFTVFTFDRLIMSLYKFNVLICRFWVLRNWFKPVITHDFWKLGGIPTNVPRQIEDLWLNLCLDIT